MASSSSIANSVTLLGGGPGGASAAERSSGASNQGRIISALSFVAHYLPPWARIHLKVSSRSSFPVRPCVEHQRVSCRATFTAPPPTGGSGEGPEPDELETLEVVIELLQEAGISKDESVQIASTSPKYAKMLRDSVKELDELSLWNSWKKDRNMEDEVIDGQLLSFKKKVKYIAKEKNDGGKIPYLESIGLSFSSAIHIARFLSAQTLPSIIHRDLGIIYLLGLQLTMIMELDLTPILTEREGSVHSLNAPITVFYKQVLSPFPCKYLTEVEYVKEIFFTGSEDERRVGNIARRMMLHLSIPIDEDVQQTLSFFEKIEARRGGLESLGLESTSLRHLIESFPRLLLLSVVHMRKVVSSLEDLGIQKHRMGNIFLLFPPIIFLDYQKGIKRAMDTYEKVDGINQDLGRMLSKYPWILCTSIQQNLGELMWFLNVEKVPEVSVKKAIRSWPLLLGCSTSKLKAMVVQFADFGVQNVKLGKVIATSPQLLLHKPQEFLKVVSFLQELGCDRSLIGKNLVRCPEMFATNVETTLQKKVELLLSMRISKRQLPRVIEKYPEVLISGVDTLIPRLQYLTRSGLSERDVAVMIGRFPPLLGYSIEDVLRPKLEFLVREMQKPVRDVVEYPRYFSYSLEKRIKPRFLVLKGGNMGAECTLKDMLGKNDEEFASDFMEECMSR